MSIVPQSKRLRPLRSHEWEWQLFARCRGTDGSVFFHPDGERTTARRNRERRGKAICAQCPVITACRRHSIAFGETYGTWGGMSENERRMMLSPGATG